MRYVLILTAIISLFTCYLKIENLKLENDLAVTISEKEKLNSELVIAKESLIKIKNANNELSKVVNDFKLSNQELSNKLHKLETKATKIASKHPKMLNKILNDAQSKVNKCFELISKGEGYDECRD